MKNDHRAQWSKLSEDYSHLSQMEEIVHGLMKLVPIIIVVVALLVIF